MPTHFEVTYGDSHVTVNEPLLAHCHVSELWLIAAAVLFVAGGVVFAIRPKAWQLPIVLPCAFIVAPLVAIVGVSKVREVLPRGGNVFQAVSAIKVPHTELELLVGLAVAALTISVACLVVKPTIPLRIASAVIATLSIAPLMQSVIVGRAINTAIGDLELVHTIPVIDTKTWPTTVHVGKPFAIDYTLPPAIPAVRNNWIDALLDKRHVDPNEWKTVSHCTASRAGKVEVTLAVERGPVRVERQREVLAIRDEGPSWMPLAVGNEWELVHVSGRDRKVGELDKAFAENKTDAQAPRQIFRVDSDAVENGLHTFVVSLTSEKGAREEHTVHRGDGALMDRDNNEIGQSSFIVPGGCLHECTRRRGAHARRPHHLRREDLAASGPRIERRRHVLRGDLAGRARYATHARVRGRLYRRPLRRPRSMSGPMRRSADHVEHVEAHRCAVRA